MTEAAKAEVVLVTGGTSGIGLGLAAAFHARGAKVIVAGRRPEALASVAARYPGLETVVIDVADAASVETAAAEIVKRFPDLSTVINNAGIQRLVDFKSGPVDPASMSLEIDTNLKGLILVSNAFLPQLLKQPNARLIHVGSGLGYVPLAAAPVYSATKAAVHSFSISLRHQLKGSAVRVIEIIPPVVETNLHAGQSRKPPNAMPVAKFVEAAMAGLDQGHDEIHVGLARVLKVAHRIAPRLFFKVVNKQR